jgi:hypothetical protein
MEFEIRDQEWNLEEHLEKTEHHLQIHTVNDPSFMAEFEKLNKLLNF